MFGKPCVNPKTLCGKKDVLMLINTPQQRYINEMRVKLNELNIPHYLMEEAVLKNHADDVLAVYDSLHDEKSREAYATMLFCRLNGEFPASDIYSSNQYFLWNEFTAKDTGGTFVDCGAFTGDSIEKYIWYKDGVVKKIWAFEPDPRNYRALNFRVQRLGNEWNLDDAKIKLFPYGVSDESTEGVVQEYSADNGLGSKIVQGSEADGSQIKIVALDDVIDEKIGFLKADIESFEYKMLLGAEKLIKEHKPCIAVCIYHNATDFYSIPLLIKKMLPDAKFVIRHHSNTLAETVLYAWCEN